MRIPLLAQELQEILKGNYEKNENTNGDDDTSIVGRG